MAILSLLRNCCVPPSASAGLLAGSQILADSQIDVDTVISALTELTKDGVLASDKAAWVAVPVEWIARARNVPLW